ncbi:MAG TPA: TRAP transporter large permease [Desulfosporosinus sp.]|nr:TRAP transporter large permease [Desulfosporosinus sp.]
MVVDTMSILMLVLFAINIPIGFSVLAVSLFYFFITGQLDPIIGVQRMLGGAQSSTLLAIPFFVLLGSLMNYTGISKRMLNLAETLTGHLPGGLAQVNVVLAMLMGGLSASSLADAAMQTKMLVPEMEKRGYDRGFAAAVIASAAQITPIIPPGIGLILFGFLANVSIGKMFMAGILPGLLMTVLNMTAVHWVSKRRGYLPTKEKPPTVKQVGIASKDAFWALFLVIVIIGGVRIGIYTPTEAGAIACFYVMIIGLFVYKEMKVIDIKGAILEAVRSTSSIMIIIMAASGFAWILTWEGVAQNITSFVTTFSTSPTVFMIAINIFLLVVGCFIEGNASMIVLIPLLLPTVLSLGINPVYFGIVMIINLAIGTLTPPMGTVMLLISGLTGVKVDKFTRELLPFYVANIVALLLITFIPTISLLLPNAMN